MKLGELKSVGHNIADSFASGIGLLVGVYEMNVFAEAASGPEGFIVVDFLAGSTSSKAASASLRKAIRRYRDALPELCSKHGLDVSNIARLEARFGTDSVYGPHFTVTVESADGKRSTDKYVGVPGKRLRRRAQQ